MASTHSEPADWPQGTFCYLRTALAVLQMSFTFSTYSHLSHLSGHLLTHSRNSTRTFRPSLHTQSSSVRISFPIGDEIALIVAQAFKHNDQEVVDFYARSAAVPIPNVPKFDSRRVVDGQRIITFFKPLPPTSAGKKFELRSKVLGVYDKGKPGTVVETETILAEKGGDVYTKAVGSAFFVGQGDWGGPKGEQIKPLTLYRC